MSDANDTPFFVGISPVVLHCGNASGYVVASLGASASSVYIACKCSGCAGKPLSPSRAGGRLFALAPDWCLHAGASAKPVAVMSEVEVCEPGVEDKMPLGAWLRDASERLGGDSLKRRQLNVFWWNGATTEADAAAASAAEAHKRKSSASGYPSGSSQPAPTAYSGYGSWRAATIRGFDPDTCRFEIKYHDEPKRSQAHIWLPFAVLHFARNPPATAAAVRPTPDSPAGLPATVIPDASSASDEDSLGAGPPPKQQLQRPQPGRVVTQQLQTKDVQQGGALTDQGTEAKQPAPGKRKQQDQHDDGAAADQQQKQKPKKDQRQQQQETQLEQRSPRDQRRPPNSGATTTATAVVRHSSSSSSSPVAVHQGSGSSGGSNRWQDPLARAVAAARLRCSSTSSTLALSQRPATAAAANSSTTATPPSFGRQAAVSPVIPLWALGSGVQAKMEKDPGVCPMGPVATPFTFGPAAVAAAVADVGAAAALVSDARPGLQLHVGSSSSSSHPPPSGSCSSLPALAALSSGMQGLRAGRGSFTSGTTVAGVSPSAGCTAVLHGSSSLALCPIVAPAAAAAAYAKPAPAAAAAISCVGIPAFGDGSVEALFAELCADKRPLDGLFPPKTSSPAASCGLAANPLLGQVSSRCLLDAVVAQRRLQVAAAAAAQKSVSPFLTPRPIGEGAIATGVLDLSMNANAGGSGSGSGGGGDGGLRRQSSDKAVLAALLVEWSQGGDSDDEDAAIGGWALPSATKRRALAF